MYLTALIGDRGVSSERGYSVVLKTQHGAAENSTHTVLMWGPGAGDTPGWPISGICVGVLTGSQAGGRCSGPPGPDIVMQEGPEGVGCHPWGRDSGSR